MTRFAIVSALSLSAVGTAQAAECAFLGNPGVYMSCIADQAWSALEQALDNEARIADLEQPVCPDGFEQVGDACIDLTCRGAGEANDSDVTTWAGASDRCEELGARLCTPSELLDTVSAGCGFDQEYLAAETPDGIARVFKRGRNVSSDGLCDTSTGYQGDFYATQYDLVDVCDDTIMRGDSGGQVDGFLCCQ